MNSTALLTIIANLYEDDLEGKLNSAGLRGIGVATILLIVLLLIAAVVTKNNAHKKWKKPLFFTIAATIILPSLFLIGSTIAVNTLSESKGPVHWHTDIEFWVCNQEIEFRDPYKFLSNKVGTSTYHEHDDKRIHLEGVVMEKLRDASFEKYMAVTEGSVTSTSIIIPTNDDIYENDTDGDEPTGDKRFVEKFIKQDDNGRNIIQVANGDSCGGAETAELQVFQFTYDTDTDTYSQTKLEDPRSYVMRDESVVPPGDCLIVEFDEPKDRSEYLCEQFGVRDSERCTEFGVSEFNPDLCNITEKSFRAPAGVDI